MAFQIEEFQIEEFRVEELSHRTGVPVDTVRYYQSKGLLDPPRRQGRCAWYNSGHVERICRIRSLQQRGFTLATIIRLLEGDFDAADEALVGRLVGEPSVRPDPEPSAASPAEPHETEQFTLSELATTTGVPLALLKALEAEELLIPRRIGPVQRYTREDVEATGAGLLLLEWGLPLSALLDLSRRHHAATVEVTRAAVEMFSSHVRGTLRRQPDASGGTGGGTGNTDELVEAFTALLPAVTTLVGHHFTRTLLRAALDHIDQVGSDLERKAVWDQINRVEPAPESAPVR